MVFNIVPGDSLNMRNVQKCMQTVDMLLPKHVSQEHITCLRQLAGIQLK